MKAQLHAAIIASLLALPSGPTAHADFDKAGAEVELGSGEITEPPPPAEACGITLEPVPEPENIALLCVTPRLRELAAGYPELSGGQIRNNYCLTDDAECQARDARRGDHQLLDEINAVRQGKLDQKTFHDSVSGSDFDRTRTDLATVSYEGYVRGVDKFFLLYRSRPDGKFHESAEGVDLVSRQAVDEEHKMQGRLLEIFAEIKAKLGKSDEDQLSLKALAHYTDRAVHAQKALALISCELGRMAEKNREIEARMGALSSKSIPLSAVSGEVPPDHLPNAEGSDQCRRKYCRRLRARFRPEARWRRRRHGVRGSQRAVRRTAGRRHRR